MAPDHTAHVELALRPQHDFSPHDIELLRNDPNTASEHDQGFCLPPTDGGKDAWLFLFACFMLEALIWGTLGNPALENGPNQLLLGFPASYGIFQEYYTHNEPFAGSSNIAIVGTCAMVTTSNLSIESWTNTNARASCIWPLSPRSFYSKTFPSSEPGQLRLV